MIKNISIKIWDRDFSLNVDYNCYPGEKVTAKQEEMVYMLMKHHEWFDKAKKKVVDYCKDKVNEDESNQKKGNVFSYLKPEYIFVKHDDSNSTIAIMFKYRYEPEHGLAVVFDENGNIKIGIQDIIL